MTTLGGTITGEVLPWDRPLVAANERVLHLMLAWSLDEPERIGEVSPIVGPVIVGRGDAQPSDLHPRANWLLARSDGSEVRTALESRRISRSQLEVRPLGKDRLQVTRIGQCALLHEGQIKDELELRAGDVFTLKNAAVFLVVARPLRFAKRMPVEMFPFGEADTDGLVGESETVWSLREQIGLANASPHHVLISGPSGTGKELVARAIHRRSGRASAPFISRNAATIPEGLVDAELFGCARGYPNAGSPERTGLIAEANDGTLFLDEIGELSHTVQAHLLRVLDGDGEYQRLGETKVRASRFRAIAATNRDLLTIKHDLGARFSSRLHTPGLEERREDIPLLMNRILRGFSVDAASAVEKFVVRTGNHVRFRTDPRLTEALLQHHFTTHLRELERILWTAVTHSHGDYIECPAELLRIPAPRFLGENRNPVPTESDTVPPVSGEDLTLQAVREALDSTHGSITAAARLLGLRNRYVLYRVLKRLGIEDGGDSDDGRT